MNGWNQTTNDCPIGDKVHPDNFTIRGWSLFHHGGFLTYPHHDSDGSATYVKVKIGMKKWLLFWPKDEESISRTALIRLAELLTEYENNREEIESKWHIEIVTLRSGDFLWVH